MGRTSEYPWPNRFADRSKEEEEDNDEGTDGDVNGTEVFVPLLFSDWEEDVFEDVFDNGVEVFGTAVEVYGIEGTVGPSPLLRPPFVGVDGIVEPVIFRRGEVKELN